MNQPPVFSPQLQEMQALATSGARAVETFERDGALHLVVPQLAEDIPGQAPSMTEGNSDTDTLVYRWDGAAFALHQRLPVPGGEDADEGEQDEEVQDGEGEQPFLRRHLAGLGGVVGEHTQRQHDEDEVLGFG